MISGNAFGMSTKSQALLIDPPIAHQISVAGVLSSERRGGGSVSVGGHEHGAPCDSGGRYP